MSSPLPRIFADIARERYRQIEKWGVQEHLPSTWLAILTEEVGEVAKEVQHIGGTSVPLARAATDYRAELVQVAAVAVAALEALDKQIEILSACGLLD